MSGNTFGTLFKLTTFGESHGHAIGGVIDGCPSEIVVDLEAIENELKRRRPGQSKIVTQRKESDKVHFYSGIFQGRTTGTPIGFVIYNENNKSKDYDHIKDAFRPSHADYTYDKKYGFRDYRGGGRSSARETACRVVAGAIAKQVLSSIKFTAYVSAVGPYELEESFDQITSKTIESNPVRCPDVKLAKEMENYIAQIKKKGDTVGGIINCTIEHLPVGLGEPVFDKLHAQLAKAMLSINAVKGFEYGSGFKGAKMLGSEHNDLFNQDGTTKTNHSGGIQGGISNGMSINFRVAFKPVATLLQNQTFLTNQEELIQVQGRGRHDPCVVPRAVPIVEAMAALVIVDQVLLAQSKLNLKEITNKS